MAKNDSKAYIKPERILNPEYTDALNEILDCCSKLFNNSCNQLSELYRISNIVSFFAGQKAYLDMLREQFSKAKKEKDMQNLRSVAYKIENNMECLAYDSLWSAVEKMYDAMIESVRQDSSNDDITATIKTAEEILEGRRRYYIESNEQKFEEQIKSIDFMLFGLH